MLYHERAAGALTIVGLPDAAVKEARERVRAAVKNCGFRFPGQPHHAEPRARPGTKKSGTLYDLPILLGILAASRARHVCRQDAVRVSGRAEPGGQAAAGARRAADGAGCAGAAACRTLYVPAENAAEATLADGLTVYGVTVGAAAGGAFARAKQPIEPAPRWEPEATPAAAAGLPLT